MRMQTYLESSFHRWSLAAIFLLGGAANSQAPRLVKDINPRSSKPFGFAELYGKTVFLADDGVHGYEPWLTDGTKLGTKLLKDIYTGTLGSHISSLVQAGDLLFFSAETKGQGYELWVTDGTPKGTRLVKDINPGKLSRFPTSLYAWKTRVLFGARDPKQGFGLWISDGSAKGTRLLKVLSPKALGSNAVREFTPFQAKIYFQAEDPRFGTELWVTDGTSQGTHLVKDIQPGSLPSQPSYLTVLGNKLYFSARTSKLGTELWMSDGTKAGTQPLKDLYPGQASSFPHSFFRSGSLIFFAANDGIHGNEIWRTDGTPKGTKLIKDIIPGPIGPRWIQFISRVRGGVLFSYEDLLHGRELWVTSGRAQGTKLLKDLYPGSTGSYPKDFVKTGSRYVYFSATTPKQGRELWRTDGTLAGTIMIPEIQPGAPSSDPSHLSYSGGILFMRAAHPTKGKEVFGYFPGAGGKQVGFGCNSSGNRIPVTMVEDPVLGRKIFVWGQYGRPGSFGLPILGSLVNKHSTPLKFIGLDCRGYIDARKFWTYLRPAKVSPNGEWGQLVWVPNQPSLKETGLSSEPMGALALKLNFPPLSLEASWGDRANSPSLSSIFWRRGSRSFPR